MKAGSGIANLRVLPACCSCSCAAEPCPPAADPGFVGGSSGVVGGSSSMLALAQGLALLLLLFLCWSAARLMRLAVLLRSCRK